MESETPKWLTKEYLQNALQHGKDYTVEIEDFKINRPVPKGENYGSNIFGAFVKYRKSNDLNNLHEISLIIKAPVGGPSADFMIKAGTFNKEDIVYNELLRKFKSIFNDEEDDFLPEAFPSSEDNVLILEDLKRKGYVLADRLKRYDYDHCVVSLKALAKFHAGSAVIHDKEPEFIERLGKEAFFFMEAKETNGTFIESNFKILAKIFKKLPEFQKYSKWFDVNSGIAFDLVADSLKRNDNEFNVLNHGDIWISNMLVKYGNNGVPEKVKLLDFQLTRYLSPAVDFWYFVEGSAQEIVRVEKFNDLVNVYLNELNSTIERLGSSKRLDKSDFEKALTNHVNYRLFTNFVALPMISANPNEVKVMDTNKITMEDFDPNKIDDNPMVAYLSTATYLNLISKRLEEMEKLGIITAE